MHQLYKKNHLSIDKKQSSGKANMAHHPPAEYEVEELKRMMRAQKIPPAELGTFPAPDTNGVGSSTNWVGRFDVKAPPAELGMVPPPDASGVGRFDVKSPPAELGTVRAPDTNGVGMYEASPIGTVTPPDASGVGAVVSSKVVR